MTKQVKSRERVAEHGEVFTAEREVNAMLDLVKQETERVDSRFLEPACGDGNFVAEILRRRQEAGYSTNISTRQRRDYYVSLESVEKICRVLNCKVDEIVEFIPDDEK